MEQGFTLREDGVLSDAEYEAHGDVTCLLRCITCDR
jgi:hypothetical protein